MVKNTIYAMGMIPVILLIISCVTCSCVENEVADIIIIHGEYFIPTEDHKSTEGIAIKDGLIIAMGSIDHIQTLKGSGTTVINAKNHYVMPGFIEGHGHFRALGQSLDELNFLDSKNWREIIAQVSEKAKSSKPNTWIIGRGWHQDKWDESPIQAINKYPTHSDLSLISSDNPVMLTHASGHALFANKRAMDIAGVTKEMSDPFGGQVVRDQEGLPIGIFEENAMNIIWSKYEESQAQKQTAETYSLWLKHVRIAEAECLKSGISSFQDAGSTYQEIQLYKELALKGELDVRLWVMIRESLKEIQKDPAGFPYSSSFLTCRAVKAYVDGALGSYGAWLLEEYHDKPGFFGQNTTSLEEIKGLAKYCEKKQMQLCVHAIGDRANREVLDIFEEQPTISKLRWRVEHAQHIDSADIPRFEELNVIASMQGVHCTSDAPFVETRLGSKRAQSGAYVWRSLLSHGVKLANGSDAPVERVSILEGIYASVSRRNKSGHQPFYEKQVMTREEALLSFTIWNAYAAYEDKLKGSLEVGKYADVVILDRNLLTCAEDELLKTKVVMTLVNGQVKYSNPSLKISD